MSSLCNPELCVTYPMLKLGSSGDCVGLVQLWLDRLGYGSYMAPEGVDCYFGPKTDYAVRQFQSDKGLDVDGIVGPMTWQAMEDMLYPPGAPVNGGPGEIGDPLTLQWYIPAGVALLGSGMLLYYMIKR